MEDRLKQIVEADFAVPTGVDEVALINEIVEELGSTDAELRDHLAYATLSNWLLKKKLLSKEPLTKLLQQAVGDDMLFHRIGEAETDTVFKRTFSSLLIALLLIRDNQEEFLSEDNVRFTMTRLIRYCELENDMRGFVEGKGWAHAAAHVADAIDECVRSRFIGRGDCHLLWNGLLALLLRAGNVYVDEEDERIATAVVAMVELGKVSVETVLSWIDGIALDAERQNRAMVQRINCKHFFRSLRSRLEYEGLLAAGDPWTRAIELKFNPYLQ